MPFKASSENDVTNIITKMLGRLQLSAPIIKFPSVKVLWENRCQKTDILMNWEMWAANPVARPTIIKLLKEGINLIPIDKDVLTIGWSYGSDTDS